MTHRIKIKENDFEYISSGRKKFMLHKPSNMLNVGDNVVMYDWNDRPKGKEIEVVITYLLDAGEMGLMFPWVIFGFELMRLKLE